MGCGCSVIPLGPPPNGHRQRWISSEESVDEVYNYRTSKSARDVKATVTAQPPKPAVKPLPLTTLPKLVNQSPSPGTTEEYQNFKRSISLTVLQPNNIPSQPHDLATELPPLRINPYNPIIPPSVSPRLPPKLIRHESSRRFTIPPDLSEVNASRQSTPLHTPSLPDITNLNNASLSANADTLSDNTDLEEYSLPNLPNLPTSFSETSPNRTDSDFKLDYIQKYRPVKLPHLEHSASPPLPAKLNHYNSLPSTPRLIRTKLPNLDADSSPNHSPTELDEQYSPRFPAARERPASAAAAPSTPSSFSESLMPVLSPADKSWSIDLAPLRESRSKKQNSVFNVQNQSKVETELLQMLSQSEPNSKFVPMTRSRSRPSDVIVRLQRLLSERDSQAQLVQRGILRTTSGSTLFTEDNQHNLNTLLASRSSPAELVRRGILKSGDNKLETYLLSTLAGT